MIPNLIPVRAVSRLAVILLAAGTCAAPTKESWPEPASHQGRPVPPPSQEVTDQPPAAAALATPEAADCQLRLSREPVTMNVVLADVRAVLQSLADRGRLNLVMGDDVRGKVTLKVSDVPLAEAFQTVVYAAGLAVEINGCIILVTPELP